MLDLLPEEKLIKFNNLCSDKGIEEIEFKMDSNGNNWLLNEKKISEEEAITAIEQIAEISDSVYKGLSKDSVKALDFKTLDFKKVSRFEKIGDAVKSLFGNDKKKQLALPSGKETEKSEPVSAFNQRIQNMAKTSYEHERKSQEIGQVVFFLTDQREPTEIPASDTSEALKAIQTYKETCAELNPNADDQFLQFFDAVEDNKGTLYIVQLPPIGSERIPAYLESDLYKKMRETKFEEGAFSMIWESRKNRCVDKDTTLEIPNGDSRRYMETNNSDRFVRSNIETIESLGEEYFKKNHLDGKKIVMFEDPLSKKSNKFITVHGDNNGRLLEWADIYIPGDVRTREETIIDL